MVATWVHILFRNYISKYIECIDYPISEDGQNKKIYISNAYTRLLCIHFLFEKENELKKK